MGPKSADCIAEHQHVRGQQRIESPVGSVENPPRKMGISRVLRYFDSGVAENYRGVTECTRRKQKPIRRVSRN